MKSDVIIEVIDRLVGSIEPYGSTQIDKERLENLETLLEVMDKYIKDIKEVTRFRNRYEYSILEIAERAYDWIVDLRDYTDDIVRENERKEE